MNEKEFDQALVAILQDRVHGASELACQALEIIALSAKEFRTTDGKALRYLLLHRAGELAASRPSMAAVVNLLNQWQQRQASLSLSGPEDYRQGAEAIARELIGRSATAAANAAKSAATLVSRGQTLMTHSLSSTIRLLFEALADRGIEAIITESRPLLEGFKLAERLSQLGIPCRLITDAQMGLMVEEADLVVVGADSLLPDGSLVNKAGTYPLALAARERSVPFYVCCESFKRRREATERPVLEQMPPEELGAPGWPRVTVINQYFDITPAHLISGWIDETGVEDNHSKQLR